MNSFFNLVQSVVKPGRCSRCMGCVLFCRSAGFDALTLGDAGLPGYESMENCIECGLCHAVCPAGGELDGEIEERAGWESPMGRVLTTAGGDGVSAGPDAQAADLTDLLACLFDLGRIDGVVLVLPGKGAMMGCSREEIVALAPWMPSDVSALKQDRNMGDLDAMRSVMTGQLNRVALVAAPCQIRSLRKMQLLNLVPAHVVAVCFGLFCRGRKTRDGCRYCSDYSSELADISWGTVRGNPLLNIFMGRTPLGQGILTEWLPEPGETTGGHSVHRTMTPALDAALKSIKKRSAEKRRRAADNLQKLHPKPIRVKI